MFSFHYIVPFSLCCLLSGQRQHQLVVIFEREIVPAAGITGSVPFHGNRNVSVCDILEKEMYSLAIQAKVITSEFYTFIETKDKTLDPVNLSCRSRITKDGYLEISWSRLEFFSANGKNYKKSTRLTKGASSFSYPMKTFEKLPSWAKDKVIGFEKKFSVLREKANALSKCRRQIENYKKLAEKSLN